MPTAGPLYLPPIAGRATALQLDGSAIGAVAGGEFLARDVAPGEHALRVELSGMPGACEISIQLAGGHSYFYEVAPRLSYWQATVPAQVMLGLPLLNLLAPAAAYAAWGIESAGKACGGGFSLEPLERDVALPKVVELTASE